VTHPSDVLLSDGSTVHIRQITSGDAGRIVALHGRFSDRTRYLRYFSPYPRIPARDLERFVNVDHHDREALVMALGDDLIAVARYERIGPAATDAEVAFVVEDAYQGRGIGPLLLEHLAEAARAAGIARFVAEVLPENQPMLKVFHDAGYHVSREWADGVVQLTFPIATTVRSVEIQRARERHPEAVSIARLLSPRAVAVYGARRDGTGAGAELLRHVVAGGFAGPVYPIHPSASTVDGMPAYRSVAEAPGPVDVALVAVPAPHVADVVTDAGDAGAHALVVVTAGFSEAHDVGTELQQALLQQARGHGLRLVGPNCFGVANTDPGVRLNATHAPSMPARGRVGVFCQSAAIGIAVLAAAQERELGLSTFASVGNRADVSGNDLLQYWREDPHTDVVLLYVESFGNPHKFARLARELGRDKPIVAVAAGAAAGHRTASDRVAWPRGQAPDDQAVAALFAQSGILRVHTIAELLDVGQLLAGQPLPAGDRVGIVGNNAALVQLADAICAQAGLGGTAPTRTVAAGSDAAGLALAVRAALADDTVDAVLVLIAPPLPGVTIGDAAAELDTAVVGADKPVVATILGTHSGQRPVPHYGTVEEAVQALAHVARYAAWRREPVGSSPALSEVDTAVAHRVVERQGPAAELLAAYGIRELPTRFADSDRAVLSAARDVGYPVVVKSAGPDLRHRLDLGAVRLDIADSRSLRLAYAEIAARFGPDVLVQPMAPPGVACVVEVVDDPAFGPVVGFGVGGMASELLGDRAWRAAPLTDVDAAALVRAPRAAAMLHGYRGATPVDVAALEDLLIRVGLLADENPAVKHLLLNPILAHPDGTTVVHAEVTYGEPIARPDTGPRRLR
jgi:acyl-CoA synthetase (NDP forming)/RimJ/RimL family protein N-acetyltransferase